MYSGTDTQKEKSLLLNLSNLLLDKGLITENECNEMKRIILEKYK